MTDEIKLAYYAVTAKTIGVLTFAAVLFLAVLAYGMVQHEKTALDREKFETAVQFIAK